MAESNEASAYKKLVEDTILKLQSPGFPGIDEVASHLNISIRTLQRKLKTEGYTYSEVMNQLRQDMAIAYLKKNELHINEIAYLLNYSDSSTFIRSFKRRTGKSPGEYRVNLS